MKKTLIRAFSLVLILALMLMSVGCSSAPAQELVIFSWADYIDPELLAQFTEETGIAINYNYYTSNEEMLTKLEAAEGGDYDIVIGIFMLLFGVNFNLYYFLLVRKFRDVFHSEELRTYLIIVATAVAAITLDILHIYHSVGTSLRHAFFQVSSIITTTGYATVDFNAWPAFSKAILVMLMFIGACAGSTGGGIKVARLVILTKSALCDMKRMLHPNAVTTVRFEGRPLAEKNVRGVHMFLAVYLLVFCASCLLVSLEQVDLVTVFTAVASCINNIGPGLEIVGPMGNFSSFSDFTKLLLSFDMLVGRLEVFPMLLLFAPSIWRQKLPIRQIRL